MDITKIESQSFQLKKEVFVLNDMISSIVEDYIKQIQESRSKFYTRLVYQPLYETVIIEADKARIAEVISNLLKTLSNLLKEGTISVKLQKKEEEDGKGYNQEVIVSVEDTGKGIDPEIFPRLFTKFTTKSYHGTGLGLFISKNVVEAHGGKVWAQNNPDGKGSTFYFSLRLNE